MDNRYKYNVEGDDDLEAERLSDHHPVYDDLGSSTVNDDPAEVNVGDHTEPDAKVKEEGLSDEEMNVQPTPSYTSFEQIKKELVVLDLERKIAWEELMSLKYEYKEDLAPSNFVPPILGTVGAISGFVLLKNLIFGK